MKGCKALIILIDHVLRLLHNNLIKVNFAIAFLIWIIWKWFGNTTFPIKDIILQAWLSLSLKKLCKTDITVLDKLTDTSWLGNC